MARLLSVEAGSPGPAAQGRQAISCPIRQFSQRGTRLDGIGRSRLRRHKSALARKLAREPQPVSTTDNGGFTVGQARLAAAMISRPGHRASRRRQRKALPAWYYRGTSRIGRRLERLAGRAARTAWWRTGGPKSVLRGACRSSDRVPPRTGTPGKWAPRNRRLLRVDSQ